MFSQILNRSEDTLYPLKFTINEELELFFPIRKVIELLSEIGFTTQRSIYTPHGVVELRCGTNRAYLTGKELLFTEDLPVKTQDNLHAHLFALLVTRIRILNQAAVQNSEAAKINLLQNQRRACVSDAYYAVFTALGSLIQYIKDTFLSQNISSISEDAFEVDPEDRRNHFTPEEAQKIYVRLNEIISDFKNKRVRLDKESCQISSENISRKNSFLWTIFCILTLNNALSTGASISSLATQHSDAIKDDPETELEDNLNEKVVKDVPTDYQTIDTFFMDMLKGIYSFVKTVNVESFAIGVSGRESFEQNFSEVFTFYRDLLNDINEEQNQFSEIQMCAIMCCFFLYSYALRQMADYEASFDSRIGIQTISRLSYYTDLFTKLVVSFTNRGTTIKRSPIVQRINSICSQELVPNYQTLSDSTDSLYSIGGVLANAKIDVFKTTKAILNNPVYAPALVNGKLFTPQEGNPIVLQRKLPFTPISLRIIISESGVIWIDVIPEETRGPMRRTKNLGVKVNPRVIENLITRYISNLEILPALDKADVLYLGGIQATREYELTLFQYINELVTPPLNLKMHVDRELDIRIQKHFGSFSGKLENIEIMTLWIEDTRDLEEIGYLIRRRRHLLEKHRGTLPVLLVYVVFHLLPLSSSQLATVEEQIQKELSDKYNVVKKVFFVSDSAINDLVLGDDSSLDQVTQKVVAFIQENEIQFALFSD